MIEVINRCFPHEVDTMVVVGTQKAEERKWEEAMVWFDQVLKYRKDSPQVHYWYGIAKREWGKYTSALVQGIAWGSSRLHFEKTIEIDPAYRDIYYQYAILERYRKHYTEAIGLTHKQLSLGSWTEDSKRYILELYDTMIHATKTDEAEAWLKSRDTLYDTYFLGELYRMTDRLEEAEHIFIESKANPGNIPVTKIYLSLVRFYVQRDDPERADHTYRQALALASNTLEMDMLMEEFMVIVDDREYGYLTQDLTLEQKKEALEIFWLKRNPLPSMAYNPRRIEHYRRLLFAEETYRFECIRRTIQKADQTGVFDYPPWYYENKKFHDKGLIYLRYGEPDAKVTVTTQRRQYSLGTDAQPVTGPDIIGLDKSMPANDSWLYHETSNRPKMIFHYSVPHDAPPEYWTLTPFFRHPEAWLAMQDWDSKFHQMSFGDMSVQNRVQNDVIHDRQQMVEHVMKTDRHSWPEETTPLPMYYSTASFRQSESQDVFQIAYAVPMADLFPKKSEQDSVHLDLGVNIFSGSIHPLFQKINTFTLTEDSDEHVYNDLFIDEVEIPMQLRPHNVSIHAEVSELNKLNGRRFVHDASTEDRTRLSLSTLKLAYLIEPEDDINVRHRNMLTIIPNPTGRFEKKEPLYAYYEIYNLSYNREGVTDYNITFEVRPKTGDQNLLNRVTGLFGGREDYSVSFENRQSGTTRTVNDYISFDMSRLKKDEYAIELIVIDNVTQEESSAQSEFQLY